ncbi:hypothetical protein BHE74_00021926, partial [Ensete ventricosum]
VVGRDGNRRKPPPEGGGRGPRRATAPEKISKGGTTVGPPTARVPVGCRPPYFTGGSRSPSPEYLDANRLGFWRFGTPVNIIVGSQVWVEDTEAAWIDGEVTAIKGGNATIVTTDGKTPEVSQYFFSSISHESQSIMQVVASLSCIYPKDTEAPQAGVDDMTKLAYLHEPGVLDNLATRYSLNEIYVRSILLINLKSHSGKTETTKMLMQYLAFMGGRSGTEGRTVEQQVLEYGKISGAAVRTYLLERSRVCQDVKKFKVADPRAFHYLNQTNCYEVANVDDAREYLETRNAMDVVGISQDEQVTYQADHFLDKNKDYVVAEHQALLNASKCPFVANLFPPLAEETSKQSKFSSIGTRFKEPAAAPLAPALSKQKSLTDRQQNEKAMVYRNSQYGTNINHLFAVCWNLMGRASTHKTGSRISGFASEVAQILGGDHKRTLPSKSEAKFSLKTTEFWDLTRSIDWFQILSVPQIYRIGTMFWDDKYGTHGLSQDVSIFILLNPSINISVLEVL